MNTEELADLATRAKRERKRRGWSQQELADKTGVVSLGTVSNFERRRYTPQPEHLRAILHTLDLEMEAGDTRAKETRDGWPAEIRVFLDVMGVFLANIAEERRAAVIYDLTRRIFTLSGDTEPE